MELFHEIAMQYFGPLARAYDLALRRDDNCWLEYANSSVRLTIAYDTRRTREVVTNVASLHDKGSPYYDFGYELYLILLFKARDPESIRGGAVRPEELDGELRSRASLFRELCGRLLAGDADEFRALQAFGRKAAHEFELRSQANSAMVRADWAWTKGDFEKVVKELAPHEYLLDPDWKQKLAEARAALTGHGPAIR